MSRLRLLGLGVRLATAGGRLAWTRLGLMALGFAIGSSLFLAAMSIVPAMQARDARGSASYGEEVGLKRAHDALLVWWTRERYADLDIQVMTVEAVGRAPVPPGLERVPVPGEIVVSPALFERWSGTAGAGLERRLRGQLAGTIAPDGVTGPDELSLWMGKPKGVDLRRREASAMVSFDGLQAASAPLDLQALLTLVVFASTVLIPIWFFVATATRLSAATREARLAAVRLAGGTQSEVRLLASVEAGVAAAVGTVVGIPLFLALRPVLAGGLILDLRFYPSDFAPPRLLSTALLVGLPVMAVVMSLVTMRQLIVSPLGVARHARRSHAGWRWAVALAAGIALLAWCAGRHEQLASMGAVEAGLLLWSALALAAFGLTGTATWTAWLVAGWFASRARSVPMLLGMRRLEADPSSVGRVVGGVALVIALVGVLQSGLVAAERDMSGTFLPPWTRGLDSDMVIAFTNQMSGWRALPGLAKVEGVESLELTRRTPFGGTRPKPTTAIVRTDGRPQILEALRDRLAWQAEVQTVAQLREGRGGGDEYESIRRGLWLVTAFLLLVNAATLLVAMIDWVMERRRALAVLSAVGVRSAELRRSILVQVSLPLATSVMFGVVGGIVVITLLYRAAETEVTIPMQELAALSVASVLVVLCVTALSMPWIRLARSPELLRSE